MCCLSKQYYTCSAALTHTHNPARALSTLKAILTDSLLFRVVFLSPSSTAGGRSGDSCQIYNITDKTSAPWLPSDHGSNHTKGGGYSRVPGLPPFFEIREMESRKVQVCQGCSRLGCLKLFINKNYI